MATSYYINRKCMRSVCFDFHRNQEAHAGTSWASQHQVMLYKPPPSEHFQVHLLDYVPQHQPTKVAALLRTNDGDFGMLASPVVLAAPLALEDAPEALDALCPPEAAGGLLLEVRIMARTFGSTILRSSSSVDKGSLRRPRLAYHNSLSSSIDLRSFMNFKV